MRKKQAKRSSGRKPKPGTRQAFQGRGLERKPTTLREVISGVNRMAEAKGIKGLSSRKALASKACSDAIIESFSGLSRSQKAKAKKAADSWAKALKNEARLNALHRVLGPENFERYCAQMDMADEYMKLLK